jgi:cytochrome P450
LESCFTTGYLLHPVALPPYDHLLTNVRTVIPHKSAEEDVYKGYRIPKGTLVVANAYAMHRDPAVYKDPNTFNPDRYLPVSEGGEDAPPPVAHFGFGRR